MYMYHDVCLTCATISPFPHIQYTNQLPKEKIDDLLRKLKSAGPNAWSGFLECLKETDQKHVSWRLEETEKLHKDNPKITAKDLKACKNSSYCIIQNLNIICS